MDRQAVTGVRHVVEVGQFDRRGIERLFVAADRMRDLPRQAAPLAGFTLATIFYEPSTRTRLSFETAMHKLGGNVISTENAREFSSAIKGESVEDTVRIVGGYADAIVILNVDQPRPAELIRTLIAAHETRFAATRPTFDGDHGHPVILSGWMRNELLEASDDDDGLRGILHRHLSELQEVPASKDQQVDLNTPEDYDEARKAFGLAS